MRRLGAVLILFAACAQTPSAPVASAAAQSAGSTEPTGLAGTLPGIEVFLAPTTPEWIVNEPPTST
jgi:hypothetical protein